LLEVRLPIVRRVCRRVAAGETVEQVCRDPMMPLRQELHAWLAEDAELAAMLKEARGLSGRAGLAREGRPGVWSKAKAAEFLARIADGRGLVEVCSEPDMPSHTTVYRWLRTRPEFAEDYAQARQMQADLLFDLAWRIARDAREQDVVVARLMIQTIKWRCARLRPTRYGGLRDLRAEQEDAPEPIPENERPVLVTIRRFKPDPDDPSKVVEYFPLDQESVLIDRRGRPGGG
jgi:hypothetical protein